MRAGHDSKKQLKKFFKTKNVTCHVFAGIAHIVTAPRRFTCVMDSLPALQSCMCGGPVSYILSFIKIQYRVLEQQKSKFAHVHALL